MKVIVSEPFGMDKDTFFEKLGEVSGVEIFWKEGDLLHHFRMTGKTDYNLLILNGNPLNATDERLKEVAKNIPIWICGCLPTLRAEQFRDNGVAKVFCEAQDFDAFRQALQELAETKNV